MHKLFTKLVSQRLILRPFERSDSQRIYEQWGKDEDVARYVTWWTHSCKEDAEAYVNKVLVSYTDSNRMEWLVCLKATFEPIGAICVFKTEKGKWGIGYNYAKAYWHKGYATEALSTVLRFLFLSCGITEVFAEHFTANPNSGKVMQRCGMTLQSMKDILCKNVTQQSRYYSIDLLTWLTQQVKTQPIISTKRLTLRSYEAMDFEYLYRLCNNRAVTKYLLNTTVTEREALEKKLASILLCSVKSENKETGLYANNYWIIADSSNKPIGIITGKIESDGITAHSSYVLAEEEWGKGYMTEALQAVIDYMFENYPDILYYESSHAQPNKVSGRVMQNCGMTCKGQYQYGVCEVIDCVSGQYPIVRYSMTRRDWKVKRGS